ncbi:MAG: ABC transporter permease [Candidatus Bathyarchaeota archaeon]|nr:ABC transporter permease [Candidatus Termiticorpusculum sp.]
MGAKRILETSFRIAWKDLKELSRNKLGLLMLILMPLLMMAMVGFIYPSGSSIDMSNLKVQVVNLDTGFMDMSVSGDFASAVNQINSASVNLAFSDGTTLDVLVDSIQRGEIDAGIVIPENFTYCVLNKQQANITIISDTSNPQVSQQVSGVLANIIESMSKQVAQSNLAAQLNITSAQAASYMAPYNVSSQGVVEGSSSYFDFIAPGLMMMTVMMSVMTGLPGAITHEREIGTLDGVMVAPINRLSIILGKTLAQLTRGLMQGLIILILATALFGVTIHGNILLVIGLLLLGVFSFVGLGVALTSLAKDQESASMMLMAIMFPMMFLSGIFFPVKMMPGFMQTISSFLPLTYASDALRKVMVLGSGIPQIATSLAILIVFGIVMLAIAVPLFRRMMTR